MRLKRKSSMDKCRINIAIIEPSQIIYEGLVNVLAKNTKHSFFYKMNCLDDFDTLPRGAVINIAIINPSVIQNRQNELLKYKKQFPDMAWLGFIYSFFDGELLKLFDDTIAVTENIDLIIGKIQKVHARCRCLECCSNELSDREIEVLVLLTKGLLNKEIAEKLNISIHTVISHRKNISEKTGIKSLSGLTIYALSKNIIALDTNVAL